MNTQTASAPRLYKPETAVRVDNDVFLGSPLPPEEPVAKNPPDGAIVDYYLPSAAKMVELEITDSTGKLVRHFSSPPKKGTASSADGHRRTLDAEANLVGEYRWCSSLRVGSALGEFRCERRH